MSLGHRERVIRALNHQETDRARIRQIIEDFKVFQPAEDMGPEPTTP